MGDGVLVYFGYPEAHEDDAERAVEAGLELVAMVSFCRSMAGWEIFRGDRVGRALIGWQRDQSNRKALFLPVDSSVVYPNSSYIWTQFNNHVVVKRIDWLSWEK
jgi:hypothetical protein